MTGRVGLILLAAGGSRRLGVPKQLLRDAEGETLLRRAARTAVASDCRPVAVVLGGSAAESAFELEGLPVQVAINPDWQTGMASSLKAGLTTLTADSALEAVVVMLCDQPMVTPPLLKMLIATHDASGHALVACEYEEVVGVPALFGRALFGELAALKADEGARRIIKAYPGPISRIAFPEGSLDVDTPDDLALLEQHVAGRLAAQNMPLGSA